MVARKETASRKPEPKKPTLEEAVAELEKAAEKVRELGADVKLRVNVKP